MCAYMLKIPRAICGSFPLPSLKNIVCATALDYGDYWIKKGQLWAGTSRAKRQRAYILYRDGCWFSIYNRKSIALSNLARDAARKGWVEESSRSLLMFKDLNRRHRKGQKSQVFNRPFNENGKICPMQKILTTCLPSRLLPHLWHQSFWPWSTPCVCLVFLQADLGWHKRPWTDSSWE